MALGGRITRLDHIVLIVDDIERSMAWYCGVLGLEPLRLDEWRAGSVPFPSARVDEGTIIDFVAGEVTGVNMNHFALVVEGVDLDEVVASGRLGPSGPPRELYGARGMGHSIHVRDPDGHVVELKTYRAAEA